MRYSDRIYDYIEANTDKVLKKGRSFIKYPFIDPGSVYDGNVWDWDTYWSVYGLLPQADRIQGGRLKDKIVEHAKGNVRNFLDWQLEDGYIPMMIEVADWNEPYLNIQHKNGYLMNMHKPFLCQQIALISEYIQDWTWIQGAILPLKKYFDCYRRYYFHENSQLYVWEDDIMIGMDNDPASFGRPKRSTANIFLNSFMVMELEAAEKIFSALAQLEERDTAVYALAEKMKCDLRKHKLSLTETIRREMYDPRDGFFYSQDIDIQTRHYDWFHKGLGVFWKSIPIRIAVWSGFLPMLAKIASQEEAEMLRSWYHNDAAFGSDYGIPTLDKREKMYRIEATNNPSDWLGPIWIVANYCVFRAMLNYGFLAEAEDICDKTVRLLEKDLAETGCFHEYYNPHDGSPVVNGGFLNWNILVLNMMDELNTWEENGA
jgi:putative isomerase